MKLKYTDVELSLDVEGEEGLADMGDLDLALTDLLVAAGQAAKSHAKDIALFIDELQYVEESQLASLITALHRCSQMQLPVTLVGAGLPQIVGQSGRAKSYAERLFDFPEIGPLDDDAARLALSAPARKECCLTPMRSMRFCGRPGDTPIFCKNGANIRGRWRDCRRSV